MRYASVSLRADHPSHTATAITIENAHAPSQLSGFVLGAVPINDVESASQLITYIAANILFTYLSISFLSPSPA